MQYREIVAVTGLGGLFHLQSTKSDGAIVRSLADNTTKFIPSRLHNVTPLESIEIYTTGNNVRLHEVLQQMKDSSEAKPDAKKASEKDIRGYFAKVYPNMDEERVYTSDMKKMLKWFEILKNAELLDFSMYQQGEGTTEEAAGTEDQAGSAEADAQLAESAQAGDTDAELVEDADKPARKSRAKKTSEEEEGAEKPAKKTAAKKKTEPAAEGEEAPKKTRARKKDGEEN
jgi:hypothetical protein